MDEKMAYLSTVIKHKTAFFDRNKSPETEPTISGPKHSITWTTVRLYGALAHIKWEVGTSVATRTEFGRTKILHHSERCQPVCQLASEREREENMIEFTGSSKNHHDIGSPSYTDK
jgi:hypothetical protein